jgi:hypothetical protein
MYTTPFFTTGVACCENPGPNPEFRRVIQAPLSPFTLDVLIWAIGQARGADFDAPTRDAWKAALADVCAAMKEGAHQP